MADDNDDTMDTELDDGDESNSIHIYYGVDVVPSIATRVKVDPSVEVIFPAAFQFQHLLAEVGLPEGLEKIGSDAFSCCQALKTINIPSTVIKIESRAFQNCISLTAIFLPQGLLKLGEGAFECCVLLQTIHVPPMIQRIEPATFSGCSGLKKVLLPMQLQEIKQSAFQGCESLVSIDSPTSLQEIGNQAFQNCNNLKTIVLPQGLLKLGEEAFEGCTTLQTIHLPPKIHAIEPATFSGCIHLSEVKFPPHLKDIKQFAFQGCESLETVDFPSSLRLIGKMAFFGAGLTDFNLPDSVEGCFSFSQCKFSNLRMPPLMTKFDSGFFDASFDDTCIISIEVSESVDQVHFPDSVLLRLPLLRSIAFPKGCSLTIGTGIGASETSYLHKLAHQLQHRFDDLPLHKLCYYHSFENNDKVLTDMKRVIHPWATKTRCGKLSAIGKRQDIFRMTPLHILACSTIHHLEMYQLLVEKYPENLTVKDKWGETPLMYTFCCNAPMGIIEFLVESYKSEYPNFDIDWESMIDSLIYLRAPVPRLRILLETHQRYFPDQKFDMLIVVARVARLMDGGYYHTKCETFRFLLRASIEKRLDALTVNNWRHKLEERFRMITTLPGWLEDHVSALYRKLDVLERKKEIAPLLELALWKAALAHHPHKKARIDDDLSIRTQCRAQCGADIVIRNVLTFIGSESESIPSDHPDGPVFDEPDFDY